MSEVTAEHAPAGQEGLPFTPSPLQPSRSAIGAVLTTPMLLLGWLGWLVRQPLRLLVCVVLLVLFGFGAWLGGLQLWAWYHYRAGRAELERYHSPAAIEHLVKCLEIWPHDPDALVLAARAARRLEDFDLAETFLDKARGMRRNYDPVVETLLLRAARGELAEVEKICQQRVEQDDPDSGLILEALVSGALRSFRIKYAQNCLQRWQEREPNNPQVLFMRGFLYEYMGVRQEAAASFRAALEIDAEHDAARLHLTLHLLDLLRGAEAIPHLEYLQSRQPDNLRIPVILAQCKDQMGEPTEAEAILDGVLARDPTFVLALAERGKIALRNGQLRDAEKWLEQASRGDPGNYSVHHMLYQCLVQNGKPKEAAEVQQHLKQIEEDVAALRDIIGTKMQKNPYDVALHYEAGMIALRSGSPKDALRWFESALKIEPQHAPTHRALAEHYHRLGQIGEAQRHWEIAKAVDPEGTKSKPPQEMQKR
jgi:tetratricopeptide (TPR) repeat protein